MNLGVRLQNASFPLSSLPDVVMYHVAQYLSTYELENMAQLNHHFRRIFNSPLLWKGITVQLPDRAIGSSALEIFTVRGIRDFLIFNRVNMSILLLPHLEKLTLCRTTTSTLEALCNVASSGRLHLKKLAFGRVDFEIRTRPPRKRTFEDLFRNLSTLEEVSFGTVLREADSPMLIELHGLGHPMASDLQRALCSSGKLTSISLLGFDSVGKSWLKTVLTNNPHLQSLCLSVLFIDDVCGQGELHGGPEQAILSSLKTFKLNITGTSSQLSGSKKEFNDILDWVFPNSKVPNCGLKGLDVTGPRVPIMFPQLLKFPGLKKLNLSNSFVPKNYSLQDFPNFENLEWLELKSCRKIMGDQLPILSDKVGKTLQYLGLSQMAHITDDDLRDLAVLFPVLRTLDLSECAKITDAVLVEWYIKHDRSEWPKLRELILKGCEKITEEVVHSVRRKTRNQLLVDL